MGDIELDLCGLKCPMPVLRTRKALRRLAPGAELVVVCTDPLATIDIPHLVQAEGHYLARQTQADERMIFVIVKGLADDACPFCTIPADAVLAANNFAIAIADRYPVRPGHILIVPRRHVPDIFGTSAAEREAIHALVDASRDRIRREDPSVAGFNIGSNVGLVAGQKIFHAHVHVIPRRQGDTPPPPAHQD